MFGHKLLVHGIQDKKGLRIVGAFDIVGSNMSLGFVLGMDISSTVLEFKFRVKRVEQGFDSSEHSLNAGLPSLYLPLSSSYFPWFLQIG